MEKEPSNETTNNSKNEPKPKKDENAAIDDDWDEDRIPVITSTIDVSKFLRHRNENDWIEAEDGRKSEITTNDDNEVNVASKESEKK